MGLTCAAMKVLCVVPPRIRGVLPAEPTKPAGANASPFVATDKKTAVPLRAKSRHEHERI